MTVAASDRGWFEHLSGDDLRRSPASPRVPESTLASDTVWGPPTGTMPVVAELAEHLAWHGGR